MDNDRIINIAVIVSGIDEEYQNDIIEGINRFTRQHNVNTSYFAAFGGMIGSNLYDIGEYCIYNLIDYDFFDAVILMTNTICNTEVKEKIIRNVRKSGIPAVIFDCADYPEIFNISIDNISAMKDIIRHTIKVHGAETLNYISGPMSNPEARDRLKAFREVMAENNLPVDEQRIYYGEFRSPDGKSAIEYFMSTGQSLPDAYICANDAMALTAVSTLEKFGYKVPDDTIVTGFDYTYNARNFTPALTSVKRPLEEAGYIACQTILDILSGNIPEKTIRLEASPIFSESCGCCCDKSNDITEYKRRTYKKIETNNENVHMLNIFAAKLAETETFEDNLNVIKDFIPRLECERFSLCLTSDWQETFMENDPEYAFSSGMTAPLIWEKNNVSSVEYFSGNEMYPAELTNGGNISFFLPIHFRERCLGYYIITNGEFGIYSLFCHTFSMNISHSLENIRKLIHINKAMDELNRLYVIDPLCDIYNRNGFINIVDNTFNECVKKNKKVMLTFVDMDGLKFINDNYGHNEGDFAIKKLAEAITESVRPGSVCARFGGDEFVIFNKNVSDKDAESFERKLNRKLENKNEIFNKPYKISASVGSIITVANDDTTLFNLIQQADDAMYEIKKRKKNSRSFG